MESAIAYGRAARKFQEIIEAQGGNPGVVDDPAVLPQAGDSSSFARRAAGSWRGSSRGRWGAGIIALGGGRAQLEDRRRPGRRLRDHRKPGDGWSAASRWRRSSRATRGRRGRARRACARRLSIADEADPPLPLVSHRVTMDGVTRTAVDA